MVRALARTRKDKQTNKQILGANPYNVSYIKQSIQTFFLGRDHKYFRVIVNNPLPSEDEVSTMMKRLLEKANVKDQQSKHDIVTNEKGKTESSPWLTRTDWKRIFIGQNMKGLYELMSMKVDAEPELALVKSSISRVIQCCLNGVNDLDIWEWNEIRFWLRSHEKDKPSAKPFRKFYVKLNTYVDIWTQLILFCWRSFENDDTGAEYLPEQRECLIQLRDIVCLGDSRTIMWIQQCLI